MIQCLNSLLKKFKSFSKAIPIMRHLETIQNYKAQTACLKKSAFREPSSSMKILEIIQLFKAQIACLKTFCKHIPRMR